MIYPEYSSLVKARETAARRIEEDFKNTADPIGAIRRANEELEKLQQKIAECEKRLFASNEFDDMVYRLRFIRGRRIENMAQILHVDVSTIYRSLRRMKKAAKK